MRFRTNIRDPKEITVLLISLALGLATGVGRWELAVILTLFVFPLLWLLERRESEEVFRTMELTVKTRNVEETEETYSRFSRGTICPSEDGCRQGRRRRPARMHR